MAHIEEGCTQTGCVADFLTDFERALQIAQRRVVVAQMVILVSGLTQSCAARLRVVRFTDRRQPVVQQGAVETLQIQRANNPLQRQPVRGGPLPCHLQRFVRHDGLR